MKIIKYFENIDGLNESWRATIITPINRISFSPRSIPVLSQILIDILGSQTKKIKRNEKILIRDLVETISETVNKESFLQNLNLERNFNIIIKNELIQISDFKIINNIESDQIETYLEDFKLKSNNLIKFKITHLVFNYKLNK